MDKEIVETSQVYMTELLELLNKRENRTSELLDIIDVLRQVTTKLDSEKNPEALINRLVNYIRSVSMAGKIKYPTEEEEIIINLGVIGQKAGLNGQYMANFSDKSQFYSIFDKNKMPRR